MQRKGHGESMKKETEVAPFTWIVRLDVHPMWVADGGTITDLDALDMLSTHFGNACMNTELAACVLAGPSATRIAHEQGYNGTSELHINARRSLDADLSREAPIAYSRDRVSLLSAVRYIRFVSLETGRKDLAAQAQQVIRALNGRDAIGDLFHAPQQPAEPKPLPARVTLPAGHRMSCEPERYLSVNEVARLLREAGIAVDQEEADD